MRYIRQRSARMMAGVPGCFRALMGNVDRTISQAGTALDSLSGMAMNKELATVEQSLEVLSETIGKASQDLCAVRSRLDQERFEIASRNTSVSRDVVRQAERVVDHLRQADEGLRTVLEDLNERE
jgi:cob(I)alamin adenosyltransferase